MNIFFLDTDVRKCAEYHVDKHSTKMCVEYAQLLCSAHHITDQNQKSNNQVPYKLSHKNHPCSIWVRESLSNYLYLCELGLELCKEYTYRYGKRHKSQEVIEWCVTNKVKICDKGFTEPPKAMPDEYKVKDVVESYRNYYRGAKSGFASWKKREVPEWYEENLELV
jgi:hypothetical protein